MFGLSFLVVSDERERRERAMKLPEETRPEAQVWFHRALLLVLSALALLIVAGKGA